MAAQTAALNLAADGIATQVTELSLHTTDGSTDGSGEVSGGSYVRKIPVYDAAASGSAVLNPSVTFDAPASSPTVTYLGFWDGAVWLGSAALTTPKTLGTGDTLTITAAPITATAA